MTEATGTAGDAVLVRSGDLHRIGRAVAWVERVQRRWSDAPNLIRVRESEDLTPVLNVSGATVPEYGLVWLVNIQTDEVSFGADQFDYPAVSTLGIASGQMPAGAPGFVWRTGIHPVLCAGYAGIPFKSRLSSQAESFYAIPGTMGLLLHVGPVAAGLQPAGHPAGVGLVKVRIQTARRELS